MKIEIIGSPTGKDVMLKIKIRNSINSPTPALFFTLSELHELEWAIRKYLEESPARNLKEGGGHE